MKIRSSVFCYLLASVAFGACGGEKPAPASEPASEPAPLDAALRAEAVELVSMARAEMAANLSARVFMEIIFKVVLSIEVRVTSGDGGRRRAGWRPRQTWRPRRVPERS